MITEDANFLTLLWSVVAGLATAIVSFIVFAAKIGRKLQLIDDLRDGFETLHKDVKDLLGRVSKIEGRIFGIAISGSPLKLTPLGLEILHESGVLAVMETRKAALIEKNQSQKPPTAYDVQEITKSIFEHELELKPEEETRLKDYAFRKGVTLQDVLMAGALYFRDIALEELGLSGITDPS